MGYAVFTAAWAFLAAGERLLEVGFSFRGFSCCRAQLLQHSLKSCGAQA